MAAIGNLMINVGARIDGLQKGLKKAENLVERSTDRFSKLDAKISKVVMGGAALGAGAFVAGLAGAAKVGLDFNNTMEKVTAQINAFTKDGDKTAALLELIKDRAALTPFAFEEMARATASLIPAAKVTNTEIEELIKLSEILAASNPAEGLEGAAFSLREALSGDFVSIVERFNLPRTRLRQLKEEGVPALEAISTAMTEMGLDAELVANLGLTASGRLSTLKDTFQVLAGIATQPIFDFFSDQLGRVNDKLATAGPSLERFLSNLTQGDTLAALMNLQQILRDFGFTNEQIYTITNVFSRIEESIKRSQDALQVFAGTDLGTIQGTITIIATEFGKFAEDASKLVEDISQITAAFKEGGIAKGLGTIGTTQFKFEPEKITENWSNAMFGAFTGNMPISNAFSGGGKSSGRDGTIGPVSIHLQPQPIIMDGQKVGEAASQRIAVDLKELIRFSGPSKL